MFHFPKILYLLGSAFCGQVTAHSFFYNGQKFPLCARCTGIYLGFFIVFIFFLIRKRKAVLIPPWSIIIILLIFVLYYVFDGLSSIFKMIWVTNLTRLFSGLFFGQALGIFLMLILNQSLLSKDKKREERLVTWFDYLILFLAKFFLLLDLS